MGSLHKNIQLMLEFPKGPFFLVLQFSYDTTVMTFLMMLSVILLSKLIILLSTLNVIRQMLWQQLELAAELESHLTDTGLGQEVAC